MPKRIQWSRKKGARKSIPDAENVTRSGKWGNEYDEVEKKNSKRFGPGYYTKATAAMLFHRDLLRGLLSFTVEDVRRDLRGKHVMCFCGLDEACHGDVLLEVANG